MCAFICAVQTNAQKGEIDSTLKAIAANPKEDTNKIKGLLYLSNLYQSVDLPQSSKYALRAKSMSEKLGDKNYLAQSMSRVASVYSWYGKTNEALTLYFKEIEIAKSLNSNYLLQDAYDGISYVYETESEWEQALQYSFKSLSIAEKSTSPVDVAYPYHELGSVYLGMGDNQKAELYLKKAKAIFVKDADTERIALCHEDLASVYINLHYYNLAKTYLDSAVTLFSAWGEDAQIAETFVVLGNLYNLQEQYDAAEDYFNRALDIYKAGGAPEADYAKAAIGLGQVAMGRKDYNKALGIFKTAYEKIKSSSNSQEKAVDCLMYLAQTDSAAGNFKEAYDFMQQYRVLYNTVYNEKKNRAAQRMLVEFDVERQSSENKVLKARYQEQQDKIVIILSAGCFVLLGALFLVVLYRQKNTAFKAIEKLQEETAEKNKEMLLANNVKDKLISMIAHDVRSPLASVQNTLTLTREQVITLEDFATLSQMLEMDIQHLTGMLDNTLMWAREQMIDLNIKKEVFYIDGVIDDLIELYSQTVLSKGITVHNHIRKNTEVVSDRDIINTVLRNIFSNAIKFTPQGKSIYIEQSSLKSKVLISIKDEGVGISDDVLSKINNKEFISTRGTDNEKGTGLGLLFSRDLLIKLGEDFQISSVPGKGTAVTISISSKK